MTTIAQVRNKRTLDYRQAGINIIIILIQSFFDKLSSDDDNVGDSSGRFSGDVERDRDSLVFFGFGTRIDRRVTFDSLAKHQIYK